MAYISLGQDERHALLESGCARMADSPPSDPNDHLDERGRRSPGIARLYSNAMDPPKTVSREGSVLRHPTPDLQSLQGAYISNVERLERSAERLSLSSSGIGEELRKIRMEQRLSDSRRSSVINSSVEDDEHSPSFSRQFSYGYGSHASNSIVGTNNVARSGGFSPAAYYASPRESVRSGSWSNHNSVKGRSVSYGTRLTQVSEPEQEGRPLDSPLSSRLVPVSPEPEAPTSPLRVVNNESYNLDDVEIPHTQSALSEIPGPEPELRPSIDTSRQASGLFADFDGVHTEYHPDGHVNPQESTIRVVSSQPRPPSRVMPYIEPLSGEDMVYYPAPVPMMLNLPKRLSKLPSAPQREKRRSEMFGTLTADARSSAVWLPDMLGSAEEGAQPSEDSFTHSKAGKRRTMADMPPQLRATMFFDQPSIRQNIEIKGDSAVETLDSILDASAFAPVSAFTDHPFAGRVGADIYEREASRPRASVVVAPQRRRSTMDILTKRNSSTDQLGEAKKSPNVLKKRNSNPNLLDDAKRRNSSLLSLGNLVKRRSSAQQLENAEEYHDAGVIDVSGEGMSLHAPVDDVEVVAAQEPYYDDAREQQEEQQQLVKEEEEQLMKEEQGVDFGAAPTTLLAELQLRKEQQKQRTRTAATAFPNGMHSTLLQLDTVDQLQKQKRKQRHTKLAWEDPGAHHPGIENEDDEDIPLGVLFAGRKMGATEKSRRLDEERPLGLIARRDMEDNEPLSHRRARLRGEAPVPRNTVVNKRNSMYTLNLPDDPGDDGGLMDNNCKEADNDNEDETLGQRVRRLRATQIPIQPRPVSGDFASEMMSQFGGLSLSEQQVPNSPGLHTTNQTPDPEETLGQRRKRLQAEAADRIRQASDESNEAAARPPMSKRRSMADILQAHPAAGAGSVPRVLSNEIKFAPAPRTRNTSWAINQSRQLSTGMGLPIASGLGAPSGGYYGMPNGVGMSGFANGGGYFPHPMVQQPVELVDGGRRDMIDRWRQSVYY